MRCASTQEVTDTPTEYLLIAVSPARIMRGQALGIPVRYAHPTVAGVQVPGLTPPPSWAGEKRDTVLSRWKERRLRHEAHSTAKATTCDCLGGRPDATSARARITRGFVRATATAPRPPPSTPPGVTALFSTPFTAVHDDALRLSTVSRVLEWYIHAAPDTFSPDAPRDDKMPVCSSARIGDD